MREIGEKPLVPQIEKEKKEKEGPEISYHFYFSPHATAKDFENLERAFEKADVYVPEKISWTKKVKKVYEDLSQGKTTPEKLLEDKELAKDFIDKRVFNPKTAKTTHQFKEWEIIYNSKKPILFADIPSEDKNFFNNGLELNSIQSRAYELFISGDFENSLATFRSFLEGLAKRQLEREKKIKENLDKEIGKFLKVNPDYAKKEKLKVLLRLGAGHSKIYLDFLKEKGRSAVSREFSQSLVYTHYGKP